MFCPFAALFRSGYYMALYGLVSFVVVLLGVTLMYVACSRYYVYIADLKSVLLHGRDGGGRHLDVAVRTRVLRGGAAGGDTHVRRLLQVLCVYCCPDVCSVPSRRSSDLATTWRCTASCPSWWCCWG